MKFQHGKIIAGFLLGFASAWALLHFATQQQQSVVEPMADSRSSSTRGSAKASQLSTGRYEKHLEIIHLASASDALQNIPISDIPSIVEAWKKRAGLSGLNDKQKSQIQKLMTNWYEKDATGAIAWLEALAPKADGYMLLEGILVFEAGRDWNHTLALVEQFSKTSLPGFFPHVLRAKMNDCDAELIGKIVRDFSPGFVMQPLKIDFKEGFDFAALGKMLAEDNGEKTIFLSYSPTNFIEEWAKEDVNAAFDWSLKNMFFSSSDVGNVFLKLTNEVGSEEANKIFIKTLADETILWDKYYCASFALQDHASPEQISNFVKQLPGSRIDHLEGLANHAQYWDGSSHDEFKSKLLSVMTPEERTLHVPITFGNKHQSRNEMIQTLKKLGHSSEEINVMMPINGKLDEAR
jgi:hypothetical protein